MPCRRCLQPVSVPSESDFLYEMEYRPGGPGLDMVQVDDEELLVFGRPEVDFAEMLTEIYAVDLPLTAVCPPDRPCEDLAGQFGTDHTHEARRSPFASLEDFDPESDKE